VRGGAVVRCPPGEPAALADLHEVPGNKSETPPSATLSLKQNVPNPFNPATEISFVVPDGGADVTLRVYHVTGRLIRTLVDGHVTAGARTVIGNGENEQGQPAATGTYFYTLTGPSFSE
jgi:hypothetical protein